MKGRDLCLFLSGFVTEGQWHGCIFELIRMGDGERGKLRIFFRSFRRYFAYFKRFVPPRLLGPRHKDVVLEYTPMAVEENE